MSPPVLAHVLLFLPPDLVFQLFYPCHLIQFVRIHNFIVPAFALHANDLHDVVVLLFHQRVLLDHFELAAFHEVHVLQRLVLPADHLVSHCLLNLHRVQQELRQRILSPSLKERHLLQKLNILSQLPL